MSLGQNPDASLVTQFIGVVSYGVFTLVVSYVVWTIIKISIGLRATKEDEEYGLDMSELGSVSHLTSLRSNYKSPHPK